MRPTDVALPRHPCRARHCAGPIDLDIMGAGQGWNVAGM
jgi:hypothetical protein